MELSDLKLPSPAPTENLAALAEAAQRDPAAFGRLYDHYVQPIYRYLRGRVDTVAEAEDLTSQTFIAAYEGLAAYRERGHFSAWLFRIARSKLVDHFRTHRREVPLEVIEDWAEAGEVLGQSARSDAADTLARLIARLEPEQRDLIHLRYVADLSYAEIGAVLGKSEGAVKKSLYRVLATLKSQMG